MARIVAVQAQVRGVWAKNACDSKAFLPSNAGNAPSTDFCVTVEVPPQRRCDQARRAVADRPSVDLDHRHHGLARRSDEGFARLLRFIDGERPHVELEALR